MKLATAPFKNWGTLSTQMSGALFSRALAQLCLIFPFAPSLYINTCNRQFSARRFHRFTRGVEIIHTTNLFRVAYVYHA